MLKKLLEKLGFNEVSSSKNIHSKSSEQGIPAELVGPQLMVSVEMVKELINIHRTRGVKGDPRARMIGDHLYQMGDVGSLSIAKSKFTQELGSKALIELEATWKGISDKPRDLNAAREIVALETAGLITDAMFKE